MARGPDRHASDRRASERHRGRTIAGRYTIESELGQGGMAEVFVARQAPLGRRVALKLIRADYAGDARLIARFEREARALAHLSDPHVVTLLDFGVTDEGELFMAMELLEGETLRARLRRQGALEPRDALEIAQQICRGLAAAHKAGVVHRDLKPENIMLTRVSAAGGEADFVKVLDLGVARVPSGPEHQTITEHGKLVGTPGYMAPETLLYGVLEDPRSDLYALGVILFEMLTGEAVFSAPTPVALVTKHARDTPRHIDTVQTEVDGLVQHLLRKEPAERPASAAAVLERIAAILSHAPVTTPRAAILHDVDVNAATQPKMQTPLTAAARIDASPSATLPTFVPPPPRRRALRVAALLVLIAALGAAVVVLGRRVSDDMPARGAAPVAPPPPPAPLPPAPEAAPPPPAPPAIEAPAAPNRPAPPPRPRKPPDTNDAKPPDEPRPRHVPDLTP